MVALGACYLVTTGVQVQLAAGSAAAFTPSATVGGRHPVQAVIVLGAAQYNGSPSPALRARLEVALKAYDALRVPIVLTGGKAPGDAFTEAFTGYRWLHDRGVPDDALLVVTDGRSTWESMVATARVLHSKEVRDVVVVSEPLHALRLRGIAAEVGLNAQVWASAEPRPLRRGFRETVAVAVGRLTGFDRLDDFAK